MICIACSLSVDYRISCSGRDTVWVCAYVICTCVVYINVPSAMQLAAYSYIAVAYTRSAHRKSQQPCNSWLGISIGRTTSNPRVT